MLYSILIREVPGFAHARSPEEQEATLEVHRTLQRDAKARGAYVGSTRLSESGAVTVRNPQQNPIVTDGPFAETKELFIGFYLLECAHIDEAIEWAKRIPISSAGSLEVRPIVWSEPSS